MHDDEMIRMLSEGAAAFRVELIELIKAAPLKHDITFAEMHGALHAITARSATLFFEDDECTESST